MLLFTVMHFWHMQMRYTGAIIFLAKDKKHLYHIQYFQREYTGGNVRPQRYLQELHF